MRVKLMLKCEVWWGEGGHKQGTIRRRRDYTPYNPDLTPASPPVMRLNALALLLLVGPALAYLRDRPAPLDGAEDAVEADSWPCLAGALFAPVRSVFVLSFGAPTHFLRGSSAEEELDEWSEAVDDQDPSLDDYYYEDKWVRDDLLDERALGGQRAEGLLRLLSALIGMFSAEE